MPRTMRRIRLELISLNGKSTPGNSPKPTTMTWQQLVVAALAILLLGLALNELSGMKALLREIQHQMIQTTLAAEESDKALIMIQTDTLAIRRLMEKQSEDPAVSGVAFNQSTTPASQRKER